MTVMIAVAAESRAPSPLARGLAHRGTIGKTCAMYRLLQSPTDVSFVQNPYPVYAQLQREGDLIWWDDYDMVCAVSHRAVTAALRDKRMGRACPPELAPDIPDRLAPFYRVEAHSMLELEPPTHTRLRGLVLRAFTSRRIAELAPDIRDLSHSLIANFPDGSFDLLDAFARPLPVIIIARLLGVPEDEADNLLAWSNAMVAMYQARRTAAIEQAAVDATQAFTAFIRDQIKVKRANPGDDLITTLIAARDGAAKLSDDELIATCILLLNAGHEATVHTLGNGVKTLLETGYRNIDAATVEEIFRFDPPLHMFTRWVYEDIDFMGHAFQRGDQIACLLGAANRDPAVYDDPHTFDPARQAPSHTAFGGGIHFCVGAPLARLEVQIALETLLIACPDLALAAPPKFGDVYHFHGLEQLIVTR